MINVSASPHIRDDVSTRIIMLDVLIALIPCVLFATINVGIKSLIIIIIAVVSAIVSETLFNLIIKTKNTVDDLSCVVTGVILALTLPPDVSYFIPAIGSVFAIIIAKKLFGGLGQNFINPAIAGRVFLTISFAKEMSSYSYNGVSSATPLVLAKNGESVEIAKNILGFIPGTIGEVSVVAILLGVIYLLFKRIIDLRIPVFYILTMMLFIIIFSGRSSDMNYILTELFSGGVFFGAFFMATDYVTSPTTNLGKVLFGIFLGLMNGIFRLYSNLAEGCQYSIMLGNLIVPFINKITIPKAFGR